MRVDGITVLEGRGDPHRSRLESSAALTRPPGLYRLEARFRALEGVSSRVQVFWEGPKFAREPVPSWRFYHQAEDISAELASDDRAASGKAAVERFGCARCHQGAFPAVSEPPPGPSLADAGGRLRRAWLMRWLADPGKVRPGARMPSLFGTDRAGFTERQVLADYLSQEPAPIARGLRSRQPPGGKAGVPRPGMRRLPHRPRSGPCRRRRTGTCSPGWAGRPDGRGRAGRVPGQPARPLS